MLALSRRPQESIDIGSEDTALVPLTRAEIDLALSLARTAGYGAAGGLIRKLAGAKLGAIIVEYAGQAGIQAKLGIDAPEYVPVNRSEVADRKAAEKAKGAA